MFHCVGFFGTFSFLLFWHTACFLVWVFSLLHIVLSVFMSLLFLLLFCHLCFIVVFFFGIFSFLLFQHAVCFSVFGCVLFIFSNFIHLVLFLFTHLCMYDCILLQFFSFWVWCCLSICSVFFFVILHFVMVFCNFISFHIPVLWSGGGGGGGGGCSCLIHLLV